MGPFLGQTFLIVVDVHSKWVELTLMPSTTSAAVTRVLEGLFMTHGLPDTIVTDNGLQFTLAPFQLFLAKLGIHHARMAPFHPAGNGLAERAVRSAKEALHHLCTTNWHHKIYQYLLAQHMTPSTTTKHSPAELLKGRWLRTTLDRLHPNYTHELPPGAQLQSRTFTIGDLVDALNFRNDIRWLPGQIMQITRPYSYRAQLTDGRVWRWHINQLRRSIANTTELLPVQDHPISPTKKLSGGPPARADTCHPSPTELFSSDGLPGAPGPATSSGPPCPGCAQSPIVPGSEDKAPPSTSTMPELRWSGPRHHCPVYLADYACAVRVGRDVESS